MKNYKISMIIPTFNSEKDLPRAINSLLKQTIGFDNIEVVIVDDCSTDNTQKIILDYSKKYENIRFIPLETNSGSAGKPRNIGIDNATSKYIMFLDNDDEYVPEACEILYNAIYNNNKNLIICSKVNNIFSNEDIQLKLNESPKLIEINILKDPRNFFTSTNYPGAMWNKIYKKEFILKNNIKCLEKLPEDVYFMHQCYYNNPEITIITNLSLYNHYFYRIKGRSITVTSSPSFLNKLFKMYDILQNLSKQYDNTELFFNEFANMYFNEMCSKIIQCNCTKEEKLNLIKKYSDRSDSLKPKMDNKIFLMYDKLANLKRFNICYIYSEIVKSLINLKRKIS